MISGSRAADTAVISLASSNADSSSSLGMVCFPSGVTLVLDATNFTSVSVPDSILKYTTAAYAPVEASQNPWRVQVLDDLFAELK